MPDTADGLYRVRTDRVGAAFVKPGASLAAYDAVIIDPVSVSYANTPAGEVPTDRARRSYPLSFDHLERLKRIFQQAVEREMARGDEFDIADAAAPNVLRITGQIVDLVWEMPPAVGGEKTFVLRTGKMTLVLDVRDSETGEPLARIADRRTIQPGAENPTGPFENNPVNNWSGVRDVSTSWARILREALDSLRDLPEVPLPRGESPRAL